MKVEGIVRAAVAAITLLGCGSSEEKTCQPECGTAVCGLETKCYTTCGECAADEACEEGQCHAACTPSCSGLSCGPDPVCGKSCGECAGTTTCIAGACVEPATCAPPASSAACTTSGYLFCGSGSCCAPDHPFFCASNGYCYTTSNGAAAVCGTGCAQCIPQPGKCAEVEATGTCGSGSANCGGTVCCSTSYQAYCPTNDHCYVNESFASSACGSACTKCINTFRCGGTGDLCSDPACCSAGAGLVCCKPPFCSGDCAYSPCC